MDIGPFMLTLINYWDSLPDYDNILKIHTKKGQGRSGGVWRDQMIRSLAGSEIIIRHNLQLLSKPDVGMLCCRDRISDFLAANAETILALRQKLGIYTGSYFAAGTMFWVKAHLYQRYCSIELLRDLYSRLEEGALIDSHVGTITHALERMFGYMVQDANLRIVGV